MNVDAPDRVDGDGRTTTSLRELIALRASAMRLRMPAQESHDSRAGQQHSRLYGRGMDYAESRVYQAGDDVRRLDWRLTARSGKLHTKLFQEEREINAMILLDTNASMFFGTRVRYKSVQAARAAALAAWCSVQTGERIGLMTFGAFQHSDRPRAGSRGVLQLCGKLAELGPPTNRVSESLSVALDRVIRLPHSVNRLLLVTDGVSCEEQAKRQLITLARRHVAVRVLIVADALEISAPPVGRYPLEYAGERHDVVLQSSRQRDTFHRALAAGQQRLTALAASLRLPYRLIDTVVDPLTAVRSVLVESARRP